MALLLLNNALPSYFNTLSMDTLMENKRSIGIVASTLLLANKSWKILRQLSLSGDSKNLLVKFIHRLLRKYMNQGFLMRSEFYPGLPWSMLVFLKGNHVIVNYGSYGTVPVQVLEHQISLQKEYELYPDVFQRTIMSDKYEQSRNIVAQHVGCQPSNLVFTENITFAMNCVLRSLFPTLSTTDAVLCLNINYSAITKVITVMTKQFNIQKIQLDITFPIPTEDRICQLFKEMFEKHPNIKIAIFDHITSASAVMLPIQKICQICQEYNVISIIDGAHAPGQVKLDIESIGADIYAGNMHKWYYTPKSCGILYIDPKLHDVIQPTVISHGCYGDLHRRFYKQSTKNYSAQITAGYAVKYVEKIGGISHLHNYITPLVEWAVELYKREWNTEELDIPHSMKAPYMRIVFFPDVFTQYYGIEYSGCDQMILDLIEEYNLSMFCNPVQGKISTRVSAQIFSGKSEYYYAVRCIKRKAEELKVKLAKEGRNKVY